MTCSAATNNHDSIPPLLQPMFLDFKEKILDLFLPGIEVLSIKKQGKIQEAMKHESRSQRLVCLRFTGVGGASRKEEIGDIVRMQLF